MKRSTTKEGLWKRTAQKRKLTPSSRSDRKIGHLESREEYKKGSWKEIG